jgi:DinB superfamily
MACLRSRVALHELAPLLRGAIERELPLLQALPPDRAATHPSGPASWSPKQELGHLIDSAANNHVRFVRAALEPEYRGPSYRQNDWVKIHDYQNGEWDFLVTLWFHYNSLLATVIENIPREKFATECTIGDGPAAALDFVIEDYVRHIQHHLDHILAREIVTAYP